MSLVLRLIPFLLLAMVSFSGPAPVAIASSEAVAPDLNALARHAVELANQERVKAGLNPLKWNDELAASGAAYAKEMASETFFSHTGRDGSTPTDRAKRAGYPAYGWGGLYVGENLGRGYNTAESVHQAWMASEGHRQNLLLPKYREIGIGLAKAADGTLYWAQEFGSRPNALPLFINGDSTSTESPSVTLTLTDEQVSPWGSVGPIASMEVSNRPDFSGAVWETFTRTKNWVLQARAGVQTVYVRLKDDGGQVVQTSGEIQYIGRVALSADEPEVLADAESSAQPRTDSMALGAAPEGPTGEDSNSY